MKINIISMSWTFERKPRIEYGEHEMNFISLINSVVHLGEFLLFKVLADKSSAVEMQQVLLSGLDGIFKTGSGNIHGEI
jgi:hypothetical protein